MLTATKEWKAALAAIIVVFFPAMIAAAMFHTEDLDLILTTNASFSIAGYPSTSIAKSAAALPSHDISFLLSMYDVPELPKDEFVTIPVRACPICVAYNRNMNTSLVVSLEDIGALFQETDIRALQSRIFQQTPSGRMTAADVFLVLATRSSVNFALNNSLTTEAVRGFAGETGTGKAVSEGASTAFPRAIRQHPRLRWVPNDADVAAAIASNSSLIGFLAPTYAAKFPGLACAMLHLAVNVSIPIDPLLGNDTVTAFATVPPRLSPAYSNWLRIGWPNVAVNESSIPSVARVEQTNLYPLLGSLLLSINITTTCNRAGLGPQEAGAAERLAMIMPTLSDDVGKRLQQYGYIPYDTCTSLHAIREMSRRVCSGATVISVKGNDDVLEGAAGLSLAYLSASSASSDLTPAFFDYEDGEGLATVPAGDTFGSTDILWDETTAQRHPTIRLLPYLSFGVSFIVNSGLDGGVSGAGALKPRLVLPKCTMLRILTGDITTWGHPEIRAANQVMFFDDSAWVNATGQPIILATIDGETDFGLNQIVVTGLLAILPECRRRYPNRKISRLAILEAIAADRTRAEQQHNVSVLRWFLHSSIVETDVDRLIDFGLRTPGSMIFLASHDVVQMEPWEAAIVDEGTGIESSPTKEIIGEMLTAAVGLTNATTRGFTLPLTRPGFYPFVGVSFFVVDVDYGSVSSRKQAAVSCEAYKTSLGFIRWALESDAAVQGVSSLQFIPLPRSASWALLWPVLSVARCRGNLVFPELTAVDEVTAITRQPWFIAVMTLIGVLLVCSAVSIWWLRRRYTELHRLVVTATEKDIEHAPKGTMFSLLFTDIESSTGLWGMLPMTMAVAMETHNEAIRRCIRQRKAYEVKTMGDAFMIALNCPVTALELAVDIQESLQDADWGVTERIEDNDEVQELLRSFGGGVDAVDVRQGPGGEWECHPTTKVTKPPSDGDCCIAVDGETTGHTPIRTGTMSNVEILLRAYCELAYQRRLQTEEMLDENATENATYTYHRRPSHDPQDYEEEENGLQSDTTATTSPVKMLKRGKSTNRMVVDAMMIQPTVGLRVRIGVHHGKGTSKWDEVAKSYDFLGGVANTASRVEDAGHGGQIVTTDAVMAAVLRSTVLSTVRSMSDDDGRSANIDILTVTSNDSALRDYAPAQGTALTRRIVYQELGWFRLRGLERRMMLIEVLPTRFQGRQFPPLRGVHTDATTEAVTRHNSVLGSQRSVLSGRRPRKPSTNVVPPKE